MIGDAAGVKRSDVTASLNELMQYIINTLFTSVGKFQRLLMSCILGIALADRDEYKSTECSRKSMNIDACALAVCV